MSFDKYLTPTQEQEDAAAKEGRLFGHSYGGYMRTIVMQRYSREHNEQEFSDMLDWYVKWRPHLTGYYDLEDIFTDQAMTAFYAVLDRKEKDDG
jgi:hypothetical protein